MRVSPRAVAAYPGQARLDSAGDFGAEVLRIHEPV
jgi:hypothetical protein